MSDEERSSVASVNESSFDEDVDQTQTSDVQEVKDSGRQRVLKIGGGIGLGVILLIAIIVPCVMLLPKTTEAVTTTQAMITEPSEPTIAPTEPPSTNATILNTTVDAANTTTELTTQRPPLVIDSTNDYECFAIESGINTGKLCEIILPSYDIRACNKTDEECFGFNQNECYGPGEGGSWSFCSSFSGWRICDYDVPENYLLGC